MAKELHNTNALEESHVSRLMERLTRVHRLVTEEDESIEDKDINSTDREMLESDANRKIKAGWTADEVYQFMKNCEEVNPKLDEGIAIRNMESVSNRVRDRLK